MLSKTAMINTIKVKTATIMFLFVAFNAIQAQAQKIANLDVHVNQEKATIYYDLVGLKDNQEVEVRLYATIKGYDMRLYRAIGDVGKGITGGPSKIIEWNNNEELTAYNKDDITFKLQVISKQQPLKAEKTKNKDVFAGLTSRIIDKD
ncbi:MAG: hypothetical protein M3512_12530 [Bacteroidota bacterium]|nr:hypothetical protein [Bacteroidota bacterium]